MLPIDLEAANVAQADDAVALKQSEMRARDEQVNDYERMWHLNLFGKLEIPATLRYLNLKPNHLALEAGCGTGRMTLEFARRCARLVCIDFSIESLKRCAAKTAQSGAAKVDFVQADLCRLPFRPGVFDRVVSCQVLEHIPTLRSREEAVGSLSRVLADGGNLCLSAYQYSWLMRLFGRKQGQHSGGIYYFRFTRNELRSLLARNLVVEAINGALVYHYIARCRKANG